MDYEFKNIELLIRDAVDSTTFTEAQYNQIKGSILTERDRIKKDFVFTFLLQINSSEQERLVRYHQYKLLNLLDEIPFSNLSNSKGSSSDRTSLNKIISETLLEMINFLAQRFTDEFDHDANLPDVERHRTNEWLQREVEEINKVLAKANPYLSSICSEAVEHFLNYESTLSFYQQSYLKEFVSSIVHQGERHLHGQNLDWSLQEILLRLNFNSNGSFEIYFTYLLKQIDLLENRKDKIKLLQQHVRIINQVQVKPRCFFIKEYPTLKERVSNWLYEEIQFLREDPMPDMTLSSVVAEDSIKKDFKLIFDMSVSQFAFFIRTLIETGILQNKNISELLRFLSKFVKTKRSPEVISDESLRIKYYDSEQSSKTAIKKLLASAISNIK